MLGKFNPSYMVDEIYDIMEPHEIATDIFNSAVITEIADYLNNKTHGEFLLVSDNYPDESGGHCAASFIDNGHPQLIFFEYEYV